MMIDNRIVMLKKWESGQEILNQFQKRFLDWIWVIQTRPLKMEDVKEIIRVGQSPHMISVSHQTFYELICQLLIDKHEPFGREEIDEQVRLTECPLWQFVWETEIFCDKSHCSQSSWGCLACRSHHHQLYQCPARRFGQFGWELTKIAKRRLPQAHVCTWDQLRESRAYSYQYNKKFRRQKSSRKTTARWLSVTLWSDFCTWHGWKKEDDEEENLLAKTGRGKKKWTTGQRRREEKLLANLMRKIPPSGSVDDLLVYLKSHLRDRLEPLRYDEKHHLNTDEGQEIRCNHQGMKSQSSISESLFSTRTIEEWVFQQINQGEGEKAADGRVRTHDRQPGGGCNSTP